MGNVLFHRECDWCTACCSIQNCDSASLETKCGNPSNLSFSWQTVGQYSVAMSFFDMALKIREESLGERHMDTGLLYNNIGACYDMLNR